MPLYRLSRTCKRIYQFLCQHIVIILVILLCLGLGIGVAGSYDLSIKLLEAQAQQFATVSTHILNETRVVYSENVIQRLRDTDGVTITPEYHEIPGAIPNPATFSIELSEHLSDRTQGSLFRLYSDYPFPHRQKTGGPQDNFEKEALVYLRKHPTASFSRRENVGEHMTFRYAEAVRMKASCVECHNTLPDSPKTDWKIGDVRGVLTVAQPLDNILLMAHKGLSSVYTVVIATTILAIFGLTLVIGRFRLISVELEKKVDERTEALNRLVNLDGLTQIANRRYFDQILEQEWRRAIRNPAPLSLLLCDVDCFKQYNDTYGHQAGDDCLRTVAQALKGSAQRAGELVARYGGEEFAVILPNVERDKAVLVANLIRKRLASFQISHATSPVSSSVTLSIGVATFIPSTRQPYEELIESADRALYQAKRQGRDRHIVWHPESLD